MQERDRGAHRAVPRPGVEQAHASCADRGERRRDVPDPVADVVDSLAAAGQEAPDMRIRAERLEQLDVRRPGRRVGHLQHCLADALIGVPLPADDH
jgi:hypothetical protein